MGGAQKAVLQTRRVVAPKKKTTVGEKKNFQRTSIMFFF